MFEASNLCGKHIGRRIMWTRLRYDKYGNTMPYAETSDDITMITHKKNGNVYVRHGRNNRQVEFKPDSVVALLTEDAPVV
jgi:hypothetical protein